MDAKDRARHEHLKQRLSTAWRSKKFYCDVSKKNYSTLNKTPGIVGWSLVALEEVNYFRWSDGTLHWMKEDEWMKSFSKGPFGRRQVDPSVMNKAALRVALTEA